MSANLAEVTLLGQFGSISLLRTNSIGGIQVDTTMEEHYEDTLEITEHPVEAGANISDHSYKRPMELVLRCGWSDSSASGLLGLASGALSAISPAASGVLSIASGINSLLNPGAGGSGSFTGGAMLASDYVAGVYSQLLQLQESRKPFIANSGLRIYSSMLLRTLSVTRNQKTQYVLNVEARLKQIIIVSTQSSTLPSQAAQAFPAGTADTASAGSQQLQTGTPSTGGSFPVK